MGVQKYFPGERIGGFYTDESETFTSAGYVVKLSAGTTNYVTKAGQGDAWLGVNAKSTEDPLNEGSFLSGTAANVPVAVDGVVRVRSKGSAVSAGQPLVVGKGGGGVVSGIQPVDTLGTFASGFSHPVSIVGHAINDTSDNFIDVKLL